MQYEEIFRGLNKHRVRYVVVGGIACILYGVVRFTKDLDLIVELKDRNLEKFFDVMARNRYSPKVPVKKEEFKDANKRRIWKKEKGMLVFSFYHQKDFLKTVDIFADEPIKFNMLYKNRKNIKAEGIKIPVASVSDLRKLKQKAGRPQDWGDINALNELARIKRIKK